MLSNFFIYEGETIPHVVARVGKQLDIPYYEVINEHLFGTRSINLTHDLPGGIDLLASNFPSGAKYDAKYMLMHHTAFPYFAPFFVQERAQLLERAIIQENSQRAYARAGLAASSLVVPKWIRFCPLCVSDDRKQNGRTYWRVLHQIQAVCVCPSHNVWLEDTYIRRHSPPRRMMLLTADEVIEGWTIRTVGLNAYDKLLLALARDTEWLLQNKLSPNPEFLIRHYKAALAKSGFATYRGTLHTKELFDAFLNKYPLSLTAPLGITLSLDNKKNWLSRLTGYSSQNLNPLYHLMFINFLGFTAASFFSQSHSNSPFGTGPWPCLNPICVSYLEFVIKTCQVEYRVDMGGRPAGVFKCNCGYQYMRSGPDTQESDVFRKTRIEEYGCTWDNRLRAEWENESKTVAFIASLFKTDVATIRRNALRLQLPQIRSGDFTISTRISTPYGPKSGSKLDKDLLQQYQERWKKAWSDNPGATTRKLAKLVPGAYATLKRHAADWLAKHSYTREYKGKRIGDIQLWKAIWRRRDRILAQQVYKLAKQLRSTKSSYERVTKSRIGVLLGRRGWLQNQLYRLPRTARVLKRECETPLQFAVRKVKREIHLGQQQGSRLSRSKVLDQANAWQYHHDPQVQKLLERIGNA